MTTAVSSLGNCRKWAEFVLPVIFHSYTVISQAMYLRLAYNNAIMIKSQLTTGHDHHSHVVGGVYVNM